MSVVMLSIRLISRHFFLVTHRSPENGCRPRMARVSLNQSHDSIFGRKVRGFVLTSEKVFHRTYIIGTSDDQLMVFAFLQNIAPLTPFSSSTNIW